MRVSYLNRNNKCCKINENMGHKGLRHNLLQFFSKIAIINVAKCELLAWIAIINVAKPLKTWQTPMIFVVKFKKIKN